MVHEGDDLYALDPGEFTAARTALAKQLKADGRKDDAAEVAKLRRPSATAWALDQIAREQPTLVEQALEAGARLRAATDEAVAGDAGELRAASAADRAASDAVVDAAAAKLGQRGTAVRPQLAATLRAAVLDDAIAAELRRGVLATDHEASSFGFGFGLGSDEEPGATAAPAPPRQSPAPKQKVAAKPARPETGRAEDDTARRAAERDAREAAEAAARAERKRRAQLEAEVKRLDHRHERLARVADQAEETARRARAEADAAALEAEAAHQQLDG